MWSGESLDFENEKYMVQAGPSLLALMSCCSCLGVSIHSNESPMCFPGGTTLPQNKINDADSHLPHHQLIRRISRSWSCPLWTITIKLFQFGTHSFEAIRLLCPHLPDKAIKLFFHTASKTLSLRFNSISGYRGQIQLHVWPSTSLKLSKRFSHHLNSLYCMPSSLHPASPSHSRTQPQGIPLEPTGPKPPEKAGHLPPLMPSKRSTEKAGDRLAFFDDWLPCEKASWEIHADWIFHLRIRLLYWIVKEETINIWLQGTLLSFISRYAWWCLKSGCGEAFISVFFGCAGFSLLPAGFL